MALSALHLFAGAGGGILSDLLLGHRTVGAVEIEDYPRRVLLERQSDGCLPPFPVWDDVQTFRIDNPDTRSYIEWLIERRDSLVIAGGFPCQDVSVAGKGAGITGERSGLWKEFARIIGEIRPRYAFIENSPALVTRGLDVVLADLAALGMDAVWTVVSAADAGAPHRRERIWILAHTDGLRLEEHELFQSNLSARSGEVANARSGRCGKPDQGQDQQPGRTEAKCASALADSHGRDAQCGSGQRPGIRKPQAGQGPNDHAGGSSQVAHAASTGCPAGGPAIGDGPHGQVCDVQSANGGCVVADPHRLRQLQPQGRECDQRGRAGDGGLPVRHAHGAGLEIGQGQPGDDGAEQPAAIGTSWWQSEPGLGRLADELPPELVSGWWDIEPDVGRVATGVQNRVGQLKALGNAQVPMQAALAWRILNDAISR